jgi:predicted metalloprotease with PDZ domain
LQYLGRPFLAVVTAAWVLFSAVPGAAQTPPVPAAAAQTPPITLRVDASRAVQGVIPVHETIPVAAGALTLQYPKWIPGEHAPSGPIANVAAVRIRAGGVTLPYTRDLVDAYAFHVTVPAGVASLDVDFVYLGSNGGNYSSARLSTPNLLSITWNKFILTPAVADYATQRIAPTIVLPGAAWKYATALITSSRTQTEISFLPVSQETLVDSPLDAGINEKTFALGSFEGAPITLAAFADTPEELDAKDATIAKLRKLVVQNHALYRHRHFDAYVFLLTLSDVMPGEGVEHHQSSDDGTDGDFLTDDAALAADGDLLAHEWNHSWDGKFRRPYDLATRNLQDPMQDDLLWVYEGMTQFYGELSAARSGLRSSQEWLDGLADTYAALDTTRGRDTMPLLDTAAAAPVLYSAGRAWSSYRRSVDFYSEGNLMWLEASVKIRALSHGKKSLDDVARAFFGFGKNTEPQVVTYTRADVIAALDAVQPYDWATFLHDRLDVVAPHPPDPFTGGGYTLVYTDTQNALDKRVAGKRKTLDMRYSLGIVAGVDGTIRDVVPGSVAFLAGVGPGEKIVAIDDRALTGDQAQIDDALKAAKQTGSLRFLLDAGNVYRTVTLAYTGGPRFPHLERVPGTADVLGAIAKPLAAVP